MEKTLEEKKGIKVIRYLVILIFLFSFVILLTAPINDALNFCDSIDWDGSTYIFPGWKKTMVDCNKAEETDAIYKIIKTIHFYDGSSD